MIRRISRRLGRDMQSGCTGRWLCLGTTETSIPRETNRRCRSGDRRSMGQTQGPPPDPACILAFILSWRFKVSRPVVCFLLYSISDCSEEVVLYRHCRWFARGISSLRGPNPGNEAKAPRKITGGREIAQVGTGSGCPDHAEQAIGRRQTLWRNLARRYDLLHRIPTAAYLHHRAKSESMGFPGTIAFTKLNHPSQVPGASGGKASLPRPWPGSGGIV